MRKDPLCRTARKLFNQYLQTRRTEDLRAYEDHVAACPRDYPELKKIDPTGPWC
jgi:hypothetical protein